MEVWIRSPHREDLPHLRPTLFVDAEVYSTGRRSGRWTASFMRGVDEALRRGGHVLGGQFDSGGVPEGAAAVWITVLPTSTGEVRARAFVDGQPRDSFVSGGLAEMYDSIVEAVNGLDLPTSPVVTATKAIELLIERITQDLEHDNSELRAALEDARIEVAFLQGQVAALREAMAMDRRPIAKSVLGVIGAVMLAVLSGAAGGAAQSGADHAFDLRDREPTVVSYIQECEAIQQMLGD